MGNCVLDITVDHDKDINNISAKVEKTDFNDVEIENIDALELKDMADAIYDTVGRDAYSYEVLMSFENSVNRNVSLGRWVDYEDALEEVKNKIKVNSREVDEFVREDWEGLTLFYFDKMQHLHYCNMSFVIRRI